MSDTPARDALMVGVSRLDQLTSDPNVAARVAVSMALDMMQADLIAALVESGWTPSDDDLRAMGGRNGETRHFYAESGWWFPKEDD